MSALMDENLRRCVNNNNSSFFHHHRHHLDPGTVIEEFASEDTAFVPISWEKNTGVVFAYGDSNQPDFTPINPTNTININTTADYTITCLMELQNTSGVSKELTFLLADRLTNEILLPFAPIAIAPDGKIYNVFLKGTRGLLDINIIELIPPATDGVNIKGLLFGAYTDRAWRA